MLAFRSFLEVEGLFELTPEQIADEFTVRVGLVKKFLVVAGWTLIITGPVAFILFLIAMFMVPKNFDGAASIDSGWHGRFNSNPYRDFIDRGDS